MNTQYDICVPGTIDRVVWLVDGGSGHCSTLQTLGVRKTCYVMKPYRIQDLTFIPLYLYDHDKRRFGVTEVTAIIITKLIWPIQQTSTTGLDFAPSSELSIAPIFK